MSMAVPEQWPEEVANRFVPIRNLGSGGFGSVVLAERKQPEVDKPKFVAIKVVGDESVTTQQVGYAHREVDILTELNHPNIVKVLEHWEPPVKDHRCAAVMALTFARGLSLDRILQKGGALSFIFGRIVIAQLVDALAYMHSRAVIHRDIKPDNMIISTSPYEQDQFWDNDTLPPEEQVEDWKPYHTLWHLTLVDFGFARALSPQDHHAETPTPAKVDINTSVSRFFLRQMSALGNRNYAAPEIQQGLKPNSQIGNLQAPPCSTDGSTHVMDNLAQCVSSYGMLADAFSLGQTIQYAMSGVPPNRNIEEAIASENSFLRRIFSRRSKGGKETPRKIKYRPLSDLPKQVTRLITGLTQTNMDKRTSVRSARRYPWIDDVFDSKGPTGNRIDYLPFTLKNPSKAIIEA